MRNKFIKEFIIIYVRERRVVKPIIISLTNFENRF